MSKWLGPTLEFLKKKKKKIYLFTWLIQVLVAALRIFDLRYGVWDLVPWPQIKPGSPALEAWNLSHWATRKVTAQTSLIQ